jgi:hypothetical protein
VLAQPLAAARISPKTKVLKLSFVMGSYVARRRSGAEVWLNGQPRKGRLLALAAVHVRSRALLPVLVSILRTCEH